MPIKWTPDKDQLMLLKLLETHDIKVDVNKIAAAWPTDQGETPSGRAITERLARIRKTIKEGGGGSASPTKAPSTPIKTSPAKRANTSKTASASKRTKAKVKKEDDSDEVDEDEVNGLDTGNIIKEEKVDESPTRRSARAAPAKINYAQLAGLGAGSGDDGEETADTGSNFGQAGGEDE